MKKCNLIFKISFITYIMALIVSQYVTAKLWADMCILLFIVALIYQFVYLFALRKKEDKKFGEVLGLFFVLAITSVSGYIFIDYLYMFINGYTPTDFIGNSLETTYYGFEAILENGWSNLIYVPYLIFNLIVLIVYKLIKRKKSI